MCAKCQTTLKSEQIKKKCNLFCRDRERDFFLIQLKCICITFCIIKYCFKAA